MAFGGRREEGAVFYSILSHELLLYAAATASIAREIE
jgi:hypothetical protein